MALVRVGVGAGVSLGFFLKKQGLEKCHFLQQNVGNLMYLFPTVISGGLQCEFSDI